MRGEEELRSSAGGFIIFIIYIIKAVAGLTNPQHSPCSRLSVPLGCPPCGSSSDTGFSFEMSRNWGWSSSEAAEAHGGTGLAESLSVRVETFGSGF